MERTTHSPHDAVFKHLLSHRATARDFLDIHLPEHLRELCNLQTLQLESGSFIDEDLRASHSDRCKPRRGTDISICLSNIKALRTVIWHFA